MLPALNCAVKATGHRFLVAILSVVGVLCPGAGLRATEFVYRDGQLQLSWDNDKEVFQIERASVIGPGRWELIASRVSGGAFSIDASGAEAFFRITRIGERIDSPAFGCDLDDEECTGPRLPPWCFGVRAIEDWKEASAPSSLAPLKFDFWQGPYQNKAGFDAVVKINAWFAEDLSAGLTQDAFRSFDLGHSSVRDFYPQLELLESVDSYDAECRDVFAPGVTFGVQSLAASADSVGDGLSVIDFYSVAELLYHYNRNEYRRLVGPEVPVFTRAFYRQLFEANTLLVSPAVASYTVQGDEAQDEFFFLSPYYLHSIGRSGSDSRLLKPLIFAAASLPRALKTRILRQGMQVPVLMWLFKSALNTVPELVDAHVPAYALPPEAEQPAPQRQTNEEGLQESAVEAYERVDAEPAPFLDALLETAHGLEHIPPVARIHHRSEAVISGGNYAVEPFIYSDPYSVQAVLRPGERLELEIDLSRSWTDEGLVASYKVQLLRDPETDTSTVIDSGELIDGRADIRIPWQEVVGSSGSRTDILLQVNDGRADSFPAYISVRHLQEKDRELFGF